jgi:hypothetical protein
VGLSGALYLTVIKPRLTLTLSGTATPSRKEIESRNSRKEEGKEAAHDNDDGRWAGDVVPSEAIENLRKKFDLTPTQMKTVMETSRKQYLSQNYDDDSWTPHQKLNVLVYGIMFSVLVFVVNRDYGNIVSIWFATRFPKEAAVLGITG